MGEVGGVWVVYGYDTSIYADAVFGDELEALRFANDQGFNAVMFWPFGMKLNDADNLRRTQPAPSGAAEGGTR